MLLLSDNASNEPTSRYKKKFLRLNRAIAQVIDDYGLIKFHPLDPSDEESIGDNLLIIDNVLQYGEDMDVKEPKEFDQDDDNDDNYDHDDEWYFLNIFYHFFVKILIKKSRSKI